MDILSVMLVAGGQNAQGGNGGGMGLLMIVLMIVIFYFFMIRPQSKRQKEEKKFREQLQKGQQIMTISGLHGKIKEVKQNTVMIEIAHDVVIEMEKTSISMTPMANNQVANDDSKK